MMCHGWMWGNGWGWVEWTLMAAVTVLFWGGLITAIVLAIRHLGGSSNVAAGRPSYRLSRPEGVLAERFAPGEIDDDQYRRRVTTLQEHR